MNAFFDSISQAESEDRLKDFQSILAEQVKANIKSQDMWVELANSSGLLGSKLDDSLFLELKVDYIS